MNKAMSIDKTQQMIDRLQDGVLVLSMEDIRDGVSFEEANLTNIKGCVGASSSAAYILLVDERDNSPTTGRVRILKARYPIECQDYMVSVRYG